MSESNFRGMDYQKKFIALLCLWMLRDGKILRVTCEHVDDVEVQEGSKVVYYQIKSTSKSSLPKSEILDSFKLFLLNGSSVNGEQIDREYVLVSNARIEKFNDNLTRHPFDELDPQTKTKIKSLQGFNGRIDILKRTYLMKSPPL